MKSFRVASLVVIALLGSRYGVEAGAKDPSKFYITMTGHDTQVPGALTENIMTFNVPVQIPRRILPAGIYRFQFLTTTLVRVTSLDEKRVYGTFTTVPIVRHMPSDGKGQVRFQLAGAQPMRLIGWFMDGRENGNQPLYRTHKPTAVTAANTASD